MKASELAPYPPPEQLKDVSKFESGIWMEIDFDDIRKNDLVKLSGDGFYFALSDPSWNNGLLGFRCEPLGDII